jgi:hypothetical protein
VTTPGSEAAVATGSVTKVVIAGCSLAGMIGSMETISVEALGGTEKEE